MSQKYWLSDLSEPVLTKFIENIVGIIFDRRAFPNLVVSSLYHIKIILDYMMTHIKNIQKPLINLMLKIL